MARKSCCKIVQDHVCTWSKWSTSLDHDKASAFLPLSNIRSMPRGSNTLASAPTNYPLNTLGGHPWSDLGGSEGPLDMSDAVNYLDAVKMQFRDKPEVYCRFLDTMQDFRRLRSVVWSLAYWTRYASRTTESIVLAWSNAWVRCSMGNLPCLRGLTCSFPVAIVSISRMTREIPTWLWSPRRRV